MLLGTLDANLVANILAGKGIIRAGKGINTASEGVVTAGYGHRSLNSSKNEKGHKNNKMHF